MITGFLSHNFLISSDVRSQTCFLYSLGSACSRNRSGVLVDAPGCLVMIILSTPALINSSYKPVCGQALLVRRKKQGQTYPENPAYQFWKAVVPLFGTPHRPSDDFP